MNKTVSINLGGQVFQIDELAYERLWKYLESIKAKYANTKGGSDIISDIESRLAEMFYEYLGFNRNVITMEDVDATINAMGQPDDFEIPLEDDEEELGGSKKASSSSSTGGNKQRRLFRNEDDKVIAGVASGLSAYFGIADPLWIRLLFLLTFIFGIGSSFLVYLVLVILVPKATTASEKLQMRGEPINIDNIEKTIREELSDLENRINNGRKGDKARGALSRLVDFIATILRLCFKVLGKAIGVFFVVISIMFLISLVLGISIPSMFDDGLALSMVPYLFESTGAVIMAITGFGLLLFIPCLFMLYAGIAILLNRRLNLKGTGLMAAGLMLVGLVMVVYTIANVSSHTDVTRKKVESVVLNAPVDGVLRLEILDDERNGDRYQYLGDWGKFMEDNDTLYVRKADEKKQIVLDIKKAPGNDFILEKNVSASGDDRDLAYSRAENISYTVVQDSASLHFPLFFTFPVEDKIRNQEVRLDLLVPVGQSVYLSHEIRELIYDIKNVTNMYDGKMVGHTWKMMPAGLTCLDCGDGDVDVDVSAVPSIPPVNGNKMVVDPFSEVEISGAVTFHLAPSNTNEVVFATKEMMEHVSVNTNGKKLTIGQNKKFSFGGEDVEVWIFTDKLDKAIILGASEGDISGFTPESFYLELAGASDCKLSITTDKLTAHLSGASELNATGTTQQLDAALAGASELSAFGLVSDQVKIHASGASNAEVYAQIKLDAEAAGASNIDYKGSPQVSSNSSGFSSINAKP